MSCLTDQMCSNNTTRFLWHWCDYKENNYQYIPNPNKTCYRTDIDEVYTSCAICYNYVDCCANSVEECCDSYFHTDTPTSSPTLGACTIDCHKKYTFDKCTFYETENTGITCIDSDNNFKCCNNNRNKCCKFRTTMVFGSLGSLLFILLVMLYYLMKSNNNKVNTEEKLTKISPV